MDIHSLFFPHLSLFLRVCVQYWYDTSTLTPLTVFWSRIYASCNCGAKLHVFSEIQSWSRWMSILFFNTYYISLYDIEQLAFFFLIVESGEGDLNFRPLFVDASWDPLGHHLHIIEIFNFVKLMESKINVGLYHDKCRMLKLEYKQPPRKLLWMV